MNVAVIGAGNVGRALGRRALGAGARVAFGTRDPDATAGELAISHPDARVARIDAAVADADIVLLTVPANAAIDALRAAGRLSGRIVVDCTNPLRWDKGPLWTPPPDGSVAQAIASAFPDARVIKGFNHFGVEIQANPALATGPVTAFFAGDDEVAKTTIMELANRMGFAAQNAGPLRNAAVLENMAVLWIHLASNGLGREFGLTIVKRA